ncbi:MAG: hypothetical protein ABEJ73_04170 [Haloplanus sp.]
MPSLTRRRALRGAAALVSGFAGCSGESSPSTSYPTESTGTVAIDPKSYRLRNPETAPVVWTGERPTARPDEERPHYRSHHFVTGVDDAASLSFADVPGVDGARAFLDATDYDTTTVYVEQWLVGECFAPELCHVEWSETDIETSYTRRYRDADVACEADAKDTLAVLIRVPEVIDPGRISGYGSSLGSSSCEQRNERIRQRRNEGRGASGGGGTRGDATAGGSGESR